jgi:hypothetical protein
MAEIIHYDFQKKVEIADREERSDFSQEYLLELLDGLTTLEPFEGVPLFFQMSRREALAFLERTGRRICGEMSYQKDFDDYLKEGMSTP